MLGTFETGKSSQVMDEVLCGWVSLLKRGTVIVGLEWRVPGSGVRVDVPGLKLMGA